MTGRSRPEVGVGAVVVDTGRLLLVRRGRAPSIGQWSVPGGRVEAGETVRAAVVRELAEETGLVGECGAFVGWSEVVDGDVHAVILDFRVHVAEPAEPVAGDDATEARWAPLAEVADLDLVAGLAAFLSGHHIIEAPGVSGPSTGGRASR